MRTEEGLDVAGGVEAPQTDGQPSLLPQGIYT